MRPSFDDAERLLKRHFGFPAFRPAQVPVVQSVLAGRDTLAVLPTGGGKSVCFQIPALALGGLTVVVSPLIALMQDQVAAALARGIPAAALHSALGPSETAAIDDAVRRGTMRLLYASPERLRRLAPVLRDQGIRPALLAVDEAHCIVEWGHDFRPAYRAIGVARAHLGRPPTLALTGSATPAVRREITRALRFHPTRAFEHVGSFDRPNLWFGVQAVGSERGRLEALLRLLAPDDHMAIVYVPTRSLAEAVAHALTQAGHRAVPYHAGLVRERRALTLKAFLDDRVDVVVATSAFGMGIDKPQVRLVVHWTLPATPEAYYQEAGRAGRDGGFARCVLLWRKGDAALHRRQLDVTFPPARLVERLWRGDERAGSAPASVRASAERLRAELRPERGPVDWSGVGRRRRQAEARIAAVEAYARGRGCRRRALVEYFGEHLECCAGCDRCPGGSQRDGPDPERGRRLERLGRSRGRPAPWTSSPPLAPTPAADAAPRRRSLLAWRAATARSAGLPEDLVIADATLEAVAALAPADRRELAGVPGLGPRALAKYGEVLLRLVAADSTGH